MKCSLNVAPTRVYKYSFLFPGIAGRGETEEEAERDLRYQIACYQRPEGGYLCVRH